MLQSAAVLQVRHCSGGGKVTVLRRARVQEAGLSLGRTSAGSGAGVHTNPRHVLAPAPGPLLVRLLIRLLVILSTSQPPS